MVQSMGLPILSCLLFQEILVEKNVKLIFKFSLCTFGTEYGIEHIRFPSYFNSKSTGYVSQAPGVPSDINSIFCNNSSN